MSQAPPFIPWKTIGYIFLIGTSILVVLGFILMLLTEDGRDILCGRYPASVRVMLAERAMRDSYSSVPVDPPAYDSVSVEDDLLVDDDLPVNNNPPTYDGTPADGGLPTNHNPANGSPPIHYYIPIYYYVPVYGNTPIHINPPDDKFPTAGTP
ncbi:hypothetical protein F4815DRAFT_449975 [Daldinia loculata]|nr:hypothetical protein F4815DRAFT_449975 [Daldinia loculata]